VYGGGWRWTYTVEYVYLESHRMNLTYTNLGECLFFVVVVFVVVVFLFVLFFLCKTDHQEKGGTVSPLARG